MCAKSSKSENEPLNSQSINIIRRALQPNINMTLLLAIVD